MKKTVIPILLLSFLLYGCSSLKDANPEVISDKHNRAVEYAQLGIKFFSERDYEKALDFYFLSLKQNISIDNEEGIISSYNSIGKTYLNSGDLESAGIYYKKANDIADYLGKSFFKAQTLNNLGELQLATGNYDSAMNYFKQALVIIEKPDKSPDAADILQNIGIVYQRNNDYEAAKSSLNESLSINSGLKRYKEMASNNYVLSSIYSKTEDYTTALIYIQNALELDKNQENEQGIAKDIYALGIIHEYLKAYEEAYLYFRKSVLIYETLSLPNEVVKTLKKLEETAGKLSLDKEAEGWFQTRKALEEKL